LRLRAVLISAVLLLSLMSVTEAAAPKEGAKCNKVGSTSTYKNYKYKCVKKAGRLVWGKGVAVKSAEATPSPTPTHLQVLHLLLHRLHRNHQHQHPLLRPLHLQPQRLHRHLLTTKLLLYLMIFVSRIHLSLRNGVEWKRG